MSYDQYGIKAGIEGTFDTGRYITEKVDIETVVTGAFNLVQTGIPSFTGQIPSTADVPNYDTDGLTATVLATATRCDQETGRSYFVSFLRGGSCNKPGAAPLASAIFYDNTTSLLVAEDVQAAIDELDARLDLVADTDDQVASEVPVTPYKTQIATNSQAAFERVEDTKIHGINPGGTVYNADFVLLRITPLIAGLSQPVVNMDIAKATPAQIGLMSAADKTKLDSLVSNYMGVYQSVADLDTAFPTGNNGDWAIVLNVAGPAQHHSWDDSSVSWEAVDFASITGQTNLSYTAAPGGGTVTSDTGADAALPVVDITNAGLMTPASLAAIAANAVAIAAIDVTTNLSYTASFTQGLVSSSAGTDAIIPLVTQAEAGLMSPTDKIRFDGLNMYDESGDISDIAYIQSRGGSIVTNFTGFLGNNYNFTRWTFDAVISPSVTGSFAYIGYYSIPRSDEFIPVDVSLTYRSSILVQQQGLPGDFSAFANEERHKQYIFLDAYDIDKNSIESEDHMRYRKAGIDSLTTLTQPLTPGDTEIHVVNAAGWNTSSSLDYHRGVTIFEYKSLNGFKHEFYSRLHERGLFNLGGVDTGTNTINLNQGFPASLANPDDVNGVWPIGSRLANTSAGATFKYAHMIGNYVPDVDKWYKQTIWVGGVDESGLNITNNFTPGTAFVKLGMLANYSNRSSGLAGHPITGPDHKFWISTFTLQEDFTAKLQVEADGRRTIYTLKTTIGVGYEFSAVVNIINEEV